MRVDLNGPPVPWRIVGGSSNELSSRTMAALLRPYATLPVDKRRKDGGPAQKATPASVPAWAFGLVDALWYDRDDVKGLASSSCRAILEWCAQQDDPAMAAGAVITIHISEAPRGQSANAIDAFTGGCILNTVRKAAGPNVSIGDKALGINNAVERKKDDRALEATGARTPIEDAARDASVVRGFGPAVVSGAPRLERIETAEVQIHGTTAVELTDAEMFPSDADEADATARHHGYITGPDCADVIDAHDRDADEVAAALTRDAAPRSVAVASWGNTDEPSFRDAVDRLELDTQGMRKVVTNTGEIVEELMWSDVRIPGDDAFHTPSSEMATALTRYARGEGVPLAFEMDNERIPGDEALHAPPEAMRAPKEEALEIVSKVLTEGATGRARIRNAVHRALDDRDARTAAGMAPGVNVVREPERPNTVSEWPKPARTAEKQDSTHRAIDDDVERTATSRTPPARTAQVTDDVGRVQDVEDDKLDRVPAMFADDVNVHDWYDRAKDGQLPETIVQEAITGPMGTRLTDARAGYEGEIIEHRGFNIGNANGQAAEMVDKIDRTRDDDVVPLDYGAPVRMPPRTPPLDVVAFNNPTDVALKLDPAQDANITDAIGRAYHDADLDEERDPDVPIIRDRVPCAGSADVVDAHARDEEGGRDVISRVRHDLDRLPLEDAATAIVTPAEVTQAISAWDADIDARIAEGDVGVGRRDAPAGKLPR